MYELKISDEILIRHASAYLEGVERAFGALRNRTGVPWGYGKKGVDLSHVYQCPKAVRYLDLVLGFHENELALSVGGILTASPARLNFLTERVDSLKRDVSESEKGCLERIDRLWSELFNYEQFVAGKQLKLTKDGKRLYFGRRGEHWSAAEFLSALGTKTCLYCNMGEVTAYSSSATGKDYPFPLDHYFPRGHYPFLGLSICNLVPACFRCNTQKKRGAKFPLPLFANPYFDNMHSLVRFWPEIRKESVFNGCGCDEDLAFIVQGENRGREAAAKHLMAELDVAERYHKGLALEIISFIGVLHQYGEEMRKDYEIHGIDAVTFQRLLKERLCLGDEREIDLRPSLKLRFDTLHYLSGQLSETMKKHLRLRRASQLRIELL